MIPILLKIKQNLYKNKNEFILFNSVLDHLLTMKRWDKWKHAQATRFFSNMGLTIPWCQEEMEDGVTTLLKAH